MTPQQRDLIEQTATKLKLSFDEFMRAVAYSQHVRCYWCHEESQCGKAYVKHLGEHQHPYFHSACLALRASVSWEAI